MRTLPRSAAFGIGLGTLVCLFIAALAPGGAQAKLYFSAFLAEGGTGIERAEVSGSGLEGLQFEPTGFEDDLALDTVHGKMYWTDTNASVISSANLNGTDPHIVLDDFGAEPFGIALDVANRKMYFTDREGVKRANLDGGEQELLTKEPARGFIALDLQAHRMYWADWPTGTIKTAAMSAEPEVTNLLVKQSTPFGVAVDHAGGKIYWLELNLKKKKSENNEIRRANLDGSEVQTLLERPGAGFEGGLAIDPAAAKMYWSEAEAHDIGVANLDGSQAQMLLSTGQDSPEGLALETTNPQPTATTAPVIEGTAQVGRPLSCNPGAWSGIGSISFAYQWAIAPQSAIEGATTSTYVPPLEMADSVLVCLVTASDNVATSTATSAAVAVAGLSGGSAVQAPIPSVPLIAGVALARITSSGTRARVPVFTSLPCTATLSARPVQITRSRRTRRAAAHASFAMGAASSRAATPRGLAVSQKLAAGRGTITLNGLIPGTVYSLTLTCLSADGQSARDTAALRVFRRSHGVARAGR